MHFLHEKIRNFKHSFDQNKENRRHQKFEEQAASLFKLCTKKSIIVLSSDCVGGRLMYDYRLPVYTPTVNNWYSDDGFLKICENPIEYFKMPLILNGERDKKGNFIGLLGDIVCHLGHEADPEKALKKWNRGCKQFFRAIKGNYEICVIMNDRNHFNDSFIKRFEALPYKNKVLFTHIPHPEAPHTFYMEGEDSLPYVKTMTLYENIFSTKRRYDRFDFYHWFYNMLNEDI